MNNGNKTDVIFVNPPLTLEERYGDLSAAGSNLPSMGLLLLAAVVRKLGLTTKIIDAPSLNLSYSETMDRIFEAPPLFLGITAVTTSVYKAAKLAEMVKGREGRIRIIIGGPHLTAVPEETMKRFPEFDIGVIGEGESTVTELFNKFRDIGKEGGFVSNRQWDALSGDLEKIPGLILRDNGSYKITDKRDTIKDLDTLPFPAWDLLPGFPDQYKPAAFKYRKLPATYVLTSRGCPHKCIFCDTSVFSRQFRYFSAEYMMEMIMLLYKKYGIREISFEDDTFLTFKKRLVKICESFIQQKLDISWSCNGRVHGVDREILKLMKRAGCWQISYGIESGDQGILDFADKHIKLEQVEHAITLTEEAGILSKGFFILGFPFDSDETIERTIMFAKRLRLNDISVAMMTPFPGSQMYEIGQKHGTINTDWQSMNLLETVFVPDGLTKEKLEYYNKKFLKEFYLRPRIMFNYLNRVMTNPGIIVPLSKAFAGFIKKVVM
ncbi:MAG: cobalamin-dependent protein [Nitrospirae bacterium]|nr:cobalamin-dependent protein [Nitrospirota bacterium]